MMPRYAFVSQIEISTMCMFVSCVCVMEELCMVSRTDKSGRGFPALEQCEAQFGLT